jgi:hypothetical protein
MSDDIKIGLSVADSGGSVNKRAAEAKALREELDKVTASANAASAALKQAASAQSAGSTYAMGGSRTSQKAPSIVNTDSEGEETGYRRARGVAQATGAGARDFARESQGLGGLVHLYATFAANIFAVGAAYEMLDKTFSVSRMEKATDMLSGKFGVNLKQVSNNLVEATGHAISFQEAIQFTNMGTAAGLTGKQIENLTVIAKGAANALGRDMSDSVRRIVQGTAKQEQEILDELGIFVKAKDAYAAYAKKIGTTANELSATEKVKAYAEAVALSGEKWKEFAAIEDPFSKFLSASKEAGIAILKNIAEPISKVLGVLADSKGAIEALMVLVVAKLAGMAVPHLGDKLKKAFAVDPTEIASFNESKEVNLKNIDRDIHTQKKTLNTAEASYDKIGSLQDNISINGFNAKRLSARLNADVGDIARIEGTDSVKIKDAIQKSIVTSIKTEDQLNDAINNKLINKTSILGKIEVNGTTVNRLTKETLAYAEATNKAYQSQVLEQEKLKALEGHRMSISEETHKRSDINNPSRAFNKDLVTEKVNLINQDLGSSGIGTWEKLGNTFRNLGGIVSEAKGNFTSLGGIALKTGAIIQMVGVASSLAIRGLLAVLGPLMLAWTAWELVGARIAESLGFFGKEASVASDSAKILKEDADILTSATLALNKAEEDATMTKKGLAKYSEAYASALNQQVDATRMAINKSIEEEASFKNRGIVYSIWRAAVAQLTLVFNKLGEAISFVGEVVSSKFSNIGEGISTALFRANIIIDNSLHKLGRLGDIILSILNGVRDLGSLSSDAPVDKKEGNLDKARRLIGVTDSGESQAKILSNEIASLQAIIDAKDSTKGLKAYAESAKLSVQSNLALVRKEMDAAAKGITLSTSTDILKLAQVGHTTALAVLEKGKKESADLARIREKDSQDPTEANSKELAMREKLAKGFESLYHLRVSNEEKLQGYASSNLISQEFSKKAKVIEAQFAKEALTAKGDELELAKLLRVEKLSELKIQQAIIEATQQSKKAAMDAAEGIRNKKLAVSSSGLDIALGNTTQIEHTKLVNEEKRLELTRKRATAEALVVSFSKSGILSTEASNKLLEADLALNIFDLEVQKAEVLRDQVSTRNKLTNQAFLYSEYMKKAIEEGATLADFTSSEVKGEELVLQKMNQQLVTLNTLSGTEKVSFAEKLKLETDLALKDAQKLERKRVLRNLEQEIDKIGTTKLTKDRVMPVLADESFARFEDFRNKMRGVITGTFDAVYKGMDGVIDSLTTKLMKRQRIDGRALIRDFGNAMAEEFRQMAADRMKLSLRTMITNSLGGPAADKAREDKRAEDIKLGGLDLKSIIAKTAGDTSAKAKEGALGTEATTDAGKKAIEAARKGTADAVNSLTDAQLSVSLLDRIAKATETTASRTLDPSIPKPAAVQAVDNASAVQVNKAIGQVSKDAAIAPGVLPSTVGTGWMDAGSTKNSIGNAGIGALSGLLMSKLMGGNNKLAPWISAIGGGLLGGLGNQQGGIMGVIGKLFGFENGGIMSSMGSLPLNKYANGGIAATPQLALFGEGRMNEAFVPLPDGRSIPVSMKSPIGAGNNVSNQANQVTVHVNPTTGTSSTNASGNDPTMMQQLGASIGAKIREELMFQKRPGGLLY